MRPPACSSCDRPMWLRAMTPSWVNKALTDVMFQCASCDTAVWIPTSQSRPHDYSWIERRHRHPFTLWGRSSDAY